tara:strand:+ start:837 stop:1043 length:207 start_codon:yes stop_codon:yes gene_type:complete
MKTFHRTTGRYKDIRVFDPTTPALRSYLMNTGQLPNPALKKTEETNKERIARIKIIRRQWASVLQQLG